MQVSFKVFALDQHIIQTLLSHVHSITSTFEIGLQDLYSQFNGSIVHLLTL